MGTTSRLSLRYPELTDSADVPRDIENLASDIDKAAIFSKGTFASRPTSTVGSPGIDGRYYFATDTSRLYLDTGTSWVEVASGTDSVTSAMIAANAVDTVEIKDGAVTSAKLASGAVTVASGTSLPSSPVDGQEYYYLVSSDVTWHFRYRSSASKWIYVGGPPLIAKNDGFETLNNQATYTTLPGGPTLTLPFAGVFDVRIQARMRPGKTGADTRPTWMSYSCATFSDSTTLDSLGLVIYDDSANNVTPRVVLSREDRVTFTGADTITAQYKCDATTVGQPGSWALRVLAVRPVTV